MDAIVLFSSEPDRVSFFQGIEWEGLAYVSGFEKRGNFAKKRDFLPLLNLPAFKDG